MTPTTKPARTKFSQKAVQAAWLASLPPVLRWNEAHRLMEVARSDLAWLSDVKHDAVQELKTQGQRIKDIADELGVTPEALYKVIREHRP